LGTGSFLGVNWPERGADHPTHLVPRLKKEQGNKYTPPLGLTGLFQDKLYLRKKGKAVSEM